MQADVDDVNVIHLEACATGIGGAGEEPKDESVEAIGRVPIGSHLLLVGLAILGSRLAVLVDKPEEEIDKNDVRFAEATLLEGRANLCRHCLEKGVGEGGVHRDDVRSCLFITGMRGPHHRAIVIVGACGEVGHVWYFGWEGHVGIRVCLR